MDALEILNELVDESDPDTDLPNIVHAFQTAEKIREHHPDNEWLQLVGLIHDLGKIMAFYDEPQWAVVGDTFVVGCKPQPSIVYSDSSFHANPDINNPDYKYDVDVLLLYLIWHQKEENQTIPRIQCYVDTEKFKFLFSVNG